MMMMCNFPKCKELPTLTYIYKELCYKHWEVLSNLTDNKKEQIFLNKIGLLRTKDGEVLRITPKRKKELKNE